MVLLSITLTATHVRSSRSSEYRQDIDPIQELGEDDSLVTSRKAMDMKDGPAVLNIGGSPYLWRLV